MQIEEHTANITQYKITRIPINNYVGDETKIHPLTQQLAIQSLIFDSP